MEFIAHTQSIDVTSLREVLELAPGKNEQRQGFRLGDDSIDEVITAIKDLEACSVTANPEDDDKENIVALESIIRLLQIGLEIQNHDYEDIGQENQTLQEENQLLKDEIQAMQNEAGDIDATNERLLLEKGKDQSKIEELEKKLSSLQDEIDRKVQDLQEMNEKLKDVQQENEEIRREAQTMALQRQSSDVQGELKIRDVMKQQDWQIDSLTRDNKDLEKANADLEDRIEDVKLENVEVSEKIVALDAEAKQLRAHAMDIEEQLQQISEKNAELVTERDRLNAELQDKMNLLDEFELRFHKQFNAWEAEKLEMRKELDNFRKNSEGAMELGERPTTYYSAARISQESSDSQEETIRNLRLELNEAKEKEILLLEAYEQLELDVGKEVERALGSQGQESEKLKRQNKALQDEMGGAQERAQDLHSNLERLEVELQEVKERNTLYEEGIYGLPQAVEEIKALKSALKTSESRQEKLVERINKMSEKLEDLRDENKTVRKKGGLTEDDTVDISDLQLERDATLSQLRSLTSQLESEVWSLEEERRQLKMELRFRAKYHGRHAIDLGLTPEQLVIVENYVHRLKHGEKAQDAEGKLVEDLNKRIKFLETRLAAAQAYGHLPSNMRPALVEDLQGNDSNVWEDKILNPMKEATDLLQFSMKGGEDADVFEIKEVAHRLSQAAEYAERLSHMAPRQEVVTSRSLTSVQPSTVQRGGNSFECSGADDLRTHLQCMAGELATLEAEVAKRDAQLELFRKQKQDIQSKLGGDYRTADAGYVPHEKYNELIVECAGLKEQLIDVMAELSEAHAQLGAMTEGCKKYAELMQGVADQRQVLYTDHVKAVQDLTKEKSGLEEKVREIEGELVQVRAANEELNRGLDCLAKSSNEEVRDSYANAVRRMAIIQMKHGKMLRDLEFSKQIESQLQQQCTDMHLFIDEATIIYRARLRFLIFVNERLERKVEQYCHELDGAVPAKAFNVLQQKVTSLERTNRQLIEELANAALISQELHRWQEQSAQWMKVYERAAKESVQSKEELRQLKLAFDKVGDWGAVEAHLNREMVDLIIKEQSSGRRAEMAEMAKERAEEGLLDAEERMKTLEERLGKFHAELEGAHRKEAELQRILSNSVTKESLDEARKELHKSSEKAKQLEDKLASITENTASSERKIVQLERELRQRQAEVLGLRSSLREASRKDEKSAAVAKLRLELEHVRGREGLVREALARSELEKSVCGTEVQRVLEDREDLLRQLARLKEELRQASHDRVRILAKLEETRANTVQLWKAELWARTLRQTRGQNESLLKALHSARQCIIQHEETVERQELQIESEKYLKDVLQNPMTDVQREVVRAREEIVKLKLEKSRLERSEILSREKIGFVERSNAELHEVLDRLERESLQQQSRMESELQAELLSRSELEDQILKLRHQCEALQAELTASKTQTEESVHAGKDKEDTNCGDREVMLRQIDGVKEARLQAEDFRQKCEDLEQELLICRSQLDIMKRDQQELLDRLEQREKQTDDEEDPSAQGQSAALSQVQAFAESTMKELRSQLSAKETQIQKLRLQIENDRGTYLKQHEVDRNEIEKLSRRLFDHGHESIQNFKITLSHPGTANSASQKEPVHDPDASSDDSTSYEQLKHLVQERELRIVALSAQVDELTGALGQLKSDHDHEMILKGQEMEALGSELEHVRSAVEVDNLRKSWREGERKLRLQLSAKDVKLKQLKEAIKGLEERLVEALKQNADDVMHESSWREQERMEEQLCTLRNEKVVLEKEVEGCRKESTRLKQELKHKEEEMKRLRKQLDKELASTSTLKTQLNKERSKNRGITMSKEQAETVQNVISSDLLERKLEEAEKRINVLETHNKKLKEAASATHGGTSADDAEKPERESQPSDRSRANLSKSTESSQKVQQWEEQKRLQKKIETLRTLVNKKNQELMQVTKEVERLHAHNDALQVDVVKQSELIRSLQEQLRKAKECQKPQADLSKVKECLEQLEVVEERKNQLELEYQRVKRQLEEKDSAPKHVERQEAQPDDEAEYWHKEEELFEACLRRDQAEAQVRRLKQTLRDLFGSDNPQIPDSRRVQAKGVRHNQHSSRQLSNAREQELLTTIETLKRGLERAQQGIPISKHRQVVEKRKELQRQVAKLSDDLAVAERAREDVRRLENRCEELQTSNLVLRRQVTKLQEASDRLEQAEAKCKQKEMEVAALSKAIASMERQAEEEREQEPVAGTSTPPVEAEVLSELQTRISELETENEDLRKELEAFDPMFFEEIEDLKHEHHQLAQQVAEYEQIIQQLTSGGPRM